MAATRAGTELTRTHRNAQLTLRAALIRDLLLLWKLFDPEQPESYGEFMQMAELLIRSLYNDSSGLAAIYYREFLAAEGLPGITNVRPAPELARERIRIALRATGLSGTLKSLRLGFSPDAALQQGFVHASGAASRLAMDGGRLTIVRSSEADGRLSGWIRNSGAKPCAFCAMLASRGPVYKESTVGFQAHDHCSCTPEPYYSGSEWPERNAQLRELWDKETVGKGGKDALNAFRHALSPAE